LEKRERDEIRVVPGEKHYADFSPGVAPIAPDGGVMPGYGIEPSSAPPGVSPEQFVCLRGPCRHYWHLVTLAPDGNPQGTWEALGIPEPKQHHHTCLVNPGVETDLNDDCVFSCSRWDPIAPGESREIDLRRRLYLDAHPEFDESSKVIDEVENDREE
jgi:hypothetical protein